MGDKAQEYTIGEACKILNITQAGMRFYERKGILESRRKEENGYRYYTFKDINRIMTIREYTNLGFTLEEATGLINTDNLYNIDDSIQWKINEIEVLINKNKRILSELNKKKQLMKKLNQHLNKYTVVEIEPMYILKCQNREKVILNNKSSESMKTWLSKTPKVRYCGYINKEDFKEGCATELGLSVKEIELDFEIKCTDSVKYIPKKQCIYTIIEVTEKHSTQNSFYKLMLPSIEYIKDNKFKLDGDVFGHKITTIFNGGQKDYYEVYFPIRKILKSY